jgi:hypothetical protein
MFTTSANIFDFDIALNKIHDCCWYVLIQVNLTAKLTDSLGAPAVHNSSSLC